MYLIVKNKQESHIRVRIDIIHWNAITDNDGYIIIYSYY